MGDVYRKLPDGSPVTKFSVTVYNQTIDMLQWWKTNFRSGGPPLKNLVDRDQTVFLIENNTGGPVDEYAVLGIDGPLFTPTENLSQFKTRTQLTGSMPTVTDHLGKWCVTLEAIPAGAIGRACLVGVVPVRVYVNGADDQYCDVIDSKTVGSETSYLGTGGTGTEILWREDAGEGEGTIVWAIVWLGAGSGIRLFELKTSIDPDTNSADAYPRNYDPDTDAYVTDYEADTFEVYDPTESRRSLGDDDMGDEAGAYGVAIGGTIVDIQEQAKIAYGTAVAKVEATAETFEVSDLTALDGGQIPPPDSGANWTIYNDNVDYDLGELVKVFLDVATGHYRPVVRKHKEEEDEDEKVKVSSDDDTADYLDAKIACDEIWIHEEVLNPGETESLKISHIGPSSVVTVETQPVLSLVGTTLSLTTPGCKFDAKGHFIEETPGGGTNADLAAIDDKKVKVSADDTTPNYLEEKIVGDGTWISTAVVTPGGDEDLKIQHIGPSTAYPTFNPTPPALSLVGNTLYLTRPFPQFDSKGHKAGDSSTSDSEVSLAGFTNTDELVKVSANDTTAGYLMSKIVGDGTWTDTEEVNDGGDEDIKIKHIGPGGDSTTNSPVTGFALSGNNIRLSHAPVKGDAKGHVTGIGTAGNIDLPLVEVTINEMRVSGGELQTRTHSFWVPKDGTTGSWTKLYDIGEC